VAKQRCRSQPPRYGFTPGGKQHNVERIGTTL
jgi:hypothetical protein